MSWISSRRSGAPEATSSWPIPTGSGLLRPPRLFPRSQPQCAKAAAYCRPRQQEQRCHGGGGDRSHLGLAGCRMAARHREALAYWSALHPPNEAAALAWGEIEGRWHRLHGARWPLWQCAGRDQPIGGLPAVMLAHGKRVHLGKRGCVLCFGRRWRSAASSALRSLGIEPPLC
jgi:hypothetical protein